MKVVELEIMEFNFYCPVTGARILSEDGYKPSPAELAFWQDETSNEPEFYNEDVKALWEAWVEKNQDDEDFCYDVVEFLSTIENAKWTAFRLESGGPLMPETATHLINMHYEENK